VDDPVKDGFVKDLFRDLFVGGQFAPPMTELFSVFSTE
jgi:hypothetical protein